MAPTLALFDVDGTLTAPRLVRPGPPAAAPPPPRPPPPPPPPPSSPLPAPPSPPPPRAVRPLTSVGALNGRCAGAGVAVGRWRGWRGGGGKEGLVPLATAS